MLHIPSLVLLSLLGAGAPQGSFEFAGSSSETTARDRAVDAAVDDLFILFRPVARPRLRAATAIAEQVRIAEENGTVLVLFAGRAPMRAVPGGSGAPWTSPTGEHMTVHLRVDGDRLVQRVVAMDGGERHNTFTQLPDGGLRLEVVIHNPRLSRPIAYALTYRAASGVP